VAGSEVYQNDSSIVDEDYRFVELNFPEQNQGNCTFADESFT